MTKYRIKFIPIERTCSVEEGETLLEAAMKTGVHINASCGGNGSCGKCRIRVIEGSVSSPRHPDITPSDYDAGIRLACMTSPCEDMVIEVPLESQVDRLVLKRPGGAASVLSASDIGDLVTGWEADPPVFKKYIELDEPTMEDNISDLGRLGRALREKHGINNISIDFRALAGLSSVLRKADWKITVTAVQIRERYKLINIEPGNREDKNYSIVIDIGTTTICAQLLDLGNCSLFKSGDRKGTGGDLCILAESSDYNPQISYGEDVITRIMYAQKKGGLKKLQEVVVRTINNLINELLETSVVKATDISHIVFAGNTVMTHIALGLDPKYIMLSPYTPAATFFPAVRAEVLGIAVKSHVYVYVFPCVASYVGGDIVAGVLGSGIFQKEKTVLFMDIGTNGEIVLGNREWLVCTSCSAGPAFEGGGIKFGMRAQKGAIEQIRINPSTFEPMVLTIGKSKPAGICGSGLIDLVAELAETGLIDQRGKFVKDTGTKRVRDGDYGCEYLICHAYETAINRDIVITEMDIDNLMRAKAAVYAGCKVLLNNVGLAFNDIDMVIISGGFGHYLDIKKARTIGLLPGLSSDKFLFVGNGALLGARLLSFSRGFLSEAERIAKTMTNIELSSSNMFMDEYIAAMFLPHTNMEEFPGLIDEQEDLPNIKK